MHLPKNISLVDGAAIPEGWITGYQLLRISGAKKGDSIVVYAGASGVGTAIIQMCKMLGIKAFAVVSG